MKLTANTTVGIERMTVPGYYFTLISALHAAMQFLGSRLFPLVLAMGSLCGLTEVCEAGTLPMAPLASAPSGNITISKPIFKWSPVSADSYVLLVKSETGTPVVKVTRSSAIVLPAGTTVCSLLCPKSLPNGKYSWQVRGKNANGIGRWSAPLYFNVAVPIPAAPTLVAPSGFVVTKTPAYQWNSVGKAEKYELAVSSGSAVVVSKIYTSGQVGGTGQCSMTPTIALPNATYTWHVRAINSAGTGQWSANGTFEVIVGWDDVAIPANDTGIVLVTPAVAETIDLRNGNSYEFGWTTNGKFYETPWSLFLVGHPADPTTGLNIVHWNFSINGSTITSNGGIVYLNATDIANSGVTTDNGFYSWVVVGWYGAHPSSRTFRVLK